MDLVLSISTRLWLSAVAIVIALTAMAGAVGYTVRIAMAVTGAGNQARAVVMNAELVLSDLRDAETGQRGYIITGTERYLVPYERAIAEIDQRLAQLKSDTGGDSLLAPKAARLEELAATKLRELAQSIALRRDQGFEPAQRFVVEGTGIDLMNRARGLTDEIDTVEQRVLNDLDTELAAANLRLLGLLLLGTPGVAGCAVLAIWTAIRSLKAPLTALECGVHRIGNGNLTEPIPIDGKDELAGLARAFNAMMDDLRTERAIRLEAEGAVRLSNEALAARSEQLERRTGTIDLLGRMANRLPGCISEIELVQVVERYAPQLLGIPGALYIFSNSLMILRTIATWGGQGGSVPEFPPADCWGLRRGQPHLIDDVTADVVCAHVSPDGLVGYRCLPLAAQGETVGLLYVEQRAGATMPADRDLHVLAETIALSLVNLRLRETLRNQSIRDPLTGLFNRRYLEESLELECERAKRSGQSVGVLMLDVDHFKLFNDSFGHEAGDMILKHLGDVLKTSIRKGDVACRYGGEEFTVVLPGASLDESAQVAEKIRGAAHAVESVLRGASLGKITISVGVAIYPGSGDTPAETIDAADQALYTAKRLGRDRVELYVPRHQALAAI